MSGETTTQLSFLVVLLFGLANLFADGVSMGLSNVLSVRSDRELYDRLRGIEHNLIGGDTDAAVERTIEVLKEKGYSDEDAQALAGIYRQNRSYWVDFFMTHEQGLADPRGENPLATGLATFISFLGFGIIPLLPFLLAAPDTQPQSLFYLSIVGTLAALLLLGLMKWRVVGNALWSSLLEVVSVGAAAASIAYFVGSLFSV